MNTSFQYLYRDASNFKRYGAVIFAGAADEGLRERLRQSLHDGEWFIADQVRLPELFFEDYPLDQDDHCWHELDQILVCDAEPTDPLQRTIEDVVREFENAAEEGWREFDRQGGTSGCHQLSSDTVGVEFGCRRYPSRPRYRSSFTPASRRNMNVPS